jgi:hypothetical protein
VNSYFLYGYRQLAGIEVFIELRNSEESFLESRELP